MKFNPLRTKRIRVI